MSSAADTERLLTHVEQLTSIALALSAEKDSNRLLEKILLGAKTLTNADGGTLYLLTADGKLQFEIMHNDSLGIAMGGSTGVAVPFEPLPLYDAEGRPNDHMVAACAAITGKTVNIEDAYRAEGFDFSGTRAFDAKTGYHSKSFLTIPMRNHVDELIGVLQVINARHLETGELVAFTEAHRRLGESLASQAAVALTNKWLVDEERRLFESFIMLIATAIDEKSPYTSGHCRRVPELTMMMAEEADQDTAAPLRDFHMTEDDYYELKIAAWMHDCGKVTTPEYVMDKATKLETIHDRIEVIDTRFEVLKRDHMIRLLAEAAGMDLSESRDPRVAALLERYAHLAAELDAEREFLRRSNVGGELMPAEAQERVRKLAQLTWRRPDGTEGGLLTDEEADNLTISKGTLTPEEREVINNHIVVTIKMLESLPWPKYLRHVPAYAGQHHERMDGRGYPMGLTGKQMSVQSRIMAIADVFEALTAADRPYKTGKTLTESLVILGKMKEDNHIDPDLFDLFVRRKIYRRYADRFLHPEQIDEVDHARIPGYAGP